MINSIIKQIIAIREFAKDIHYTCHGDSFYAKHLLADRVYNDLEPYIDQLKESCLLGEQQKPLASLIYLQGAIDLLIKPNLTSDLTNFAYLKTLIHNCWKVIEEGKGQSSLGREDLLGSISNTLQTLEGLIELQMQL
mgnify:CR=1 FL=1